ncbi:MAG TPA: hypothetical protein VMF61_16775 [Candidatus Acidoferrales bacterium]|nr:hypothetical protein [Candidatus Acidoferrales bacterium]
MKRLTLTLAAAALLAASALPAIASDTLTVPTVASAPSGTSGFSGAVASVDWNATDRRRADEPATVNAVSDGKYLYVRFDVPQREPMIGGSGGDYVAIDLWPNGQDGDVYHYGVDIGGTRTSDSTPNTAGWDATASAHPGGYTVTMRIPASAAQGNGTSQVQFSRWIASTGELQTWAHGAGGTDVAQAGTLVIASSVGAAQP